MPWPFRRRRSLKSEADGRNYQISGYRTPASTGEDVDLVHQLQQGDHDALTSLFEKYSAMIFGIARRMLGDDGEAEEVVQQVFLDTYRAIDQFDHHKASYKTWLFQYVYHRAINRREYLETRGFYAAAELDEEELPIDLYEGAGRALGLSSQEIAQLVQEILNSIQPKQRVAIELTFFEGLTAEEIATRTGETAVTVRHNLYRGLSKLRAALVGDAQSHKLSAKRERKTTLADAARPL